MHVCKSTCHRRNSLLHKANETDKTDKVDEINTQSK